MAADEGNVGLAAGNITCPHGGSAAAAKHYAGIGAGLKEGKGAPDMLGCGGAQLAAGEEQVFAVTGGGIKTLAAAEIQLPQPVIVETGDPLFLLPYNSTTSGLQNRLQ